MASDVPIVRVEVLAPGESVLVASPCALLMAPGEVTVESSADENVARFTVTSGVYGLQVSESVAIAPDGTMFDPRTLRVGADGTAVAQRAGG